MVRIDDCRLFEKFVTEYEIDKLFNEDMRKYMTLYM